MSSRVQVAVCVDLSEGASPSRVDREAGVIRGVKLLGWRSQNGREYDPAGVDPRLYEGRVVNFNHHRGAGERSVYDRFGRIVNARKAADGVYGDLEYLRSHPYAESVAEAAERMPNVYGLSHTARGCERRNPSGVATIEKMESVQSVDLVGDPATVAGLYESKGGRMATLTLKELAESLKTKRPGYSKALLEMAEAGLMNSDSLMPEPQGDAMGDAADHKQAILDACKACIDDDALDPDAKVQKIKKLLSIHKDEEAKTPPPPGEGEGEGEGEGDEMAKEESVQLKARLARLETRERLRNAADEAGVRLTKGLLESVRHDLTDAEVKSLVAEIKAQQKADASRPRSAAPGAAGKPLSEGRVAGAPAVDVKAVAARINGRG